MLISALILAVLPSLVIISFKSFTLFRRIWKSSNGILSIREFVDMFDNGISYWVMMSNSYGKILSKMHGEEEKFSYTRRDAIITIKQWMNCTG